MNTIGEIIKEIAGKPRKGMSPEQRLSMLLKHPTIQEFSSTYPEVTRTDFRRSLAHLTQAVVEAENCQRCKSLRTCPNLIRGHSSKMIKYGDVLDLQVVPCSKYLREKEETKNKNLIRSHHIPKDILEATFHSTEAGDGRMDAFDAAVGFCNRFCSSEWPKTGLYFYGPLGSGKSWLAGAIANEIARHGVDSYMFYVPEFMREVTESIHDNSLHRKMEKLKSVSVLILDDIGAEFLTPWKRDEILGAILQYRVSEQLPTIFTSNLDLDELEKHFLQTNRDPDAMKAARVMERIRYYTTAYRVDGKNWREEGK